MRRRGFRVPHTLVLLFGMILLAQLLTYLLPAGEFRSKEVSSVGAHDVIRLPLAGEYRCEGGAFVLPAAGAYVHSPEVEGGSEGEPVAPSFDVPAAGEYVHSSGVSVRIDTAGRYRQADGIGTREAVVPNTYTTVAEHPRLPWYAFLTLIPHGFEKGAHIIMFILIVGGAFGVLRATGTTDALIGFVLQKLGKRPGVLMLGGMAVFAVGSSAIGMAEEYIPFVTVLVAMCVALGYDAVTAIGILCLGYAVGYGTAAINPFTVVIAQNIAGLPETSGKWYRIVLLFPFLALGFHHLWSYARKVKTDPSASLVADVEVDWKAHEGGYPTFNVRHLLAIVLLIAGIGYFVYGINEWGWYLDEMMSLFIALTVLIAIVGKLSADQAAGSFCEGAGELATTALLIGFAYTIEVVLSEGRITHTIIHGVAQPLQELGPAFAAIGMFLVQSLCNFFIPSGSGQAYVTMPLMAPLADVVGVHRQVAVLAYQFGDGFTNILVPTNAVLVGILAIARIPFERWVRFVFPFMLKVWVLGSVALAVAVWIGYE